MLSSLQRSRSRGRGVFSSDQLHCTCSVTTPVSSKMWKEESERSGGCSFWFRRFIVICHFAPGSMQEVLANRVPVLIILQAIPSKSCAAVKAVCVLLDNLGILLDSSGANVADDENVMLNFNDLKWLPGNKRYIRRGDRLSSPTIEDSRRRNAIHLAPADDAP